MLQTEFKVLNNTSLKRTIYKILLLRIMAINFLLFFLVQNGDFDFYRTTY